MLLFLWISLLFIYVKPVLVSHLLFLLLLVASIIEFFIHYAQVSNFNTSGTKSVYILVALVIASIFRKCAANVLVLLASEGQKYRYQWQHPSNREKLAPWTDKMTIVFTLYFVVNLVQMVLQNAELSEYPYMQIPI